MRVKHNIQDLAIFDGTASFSRPVSTSSLYQPDIERFLEYSRIFFQEAHYTNNGKLVQELERRLCAFHNTEYCVTFCSGFWALALTISTLALKGKSEIVMPSLTYRRMADIAAWVGLKPRFCEVDQKSLAITAETAASCITDETALILGVHPIVNCCDVDGLVALGKQHGVPVLFDSVESMYESIPAGKIGGFGEAECFSMHASKLLNGFEGGYVTTNNKELARVLSSKRTFGFEGQDNIAMAGGLNAKLNEVHAAMALAGLDELERLVSDNKERYRLYQDKLANHQAIRLLAFDEAHATSYKNIVIELLPGWPLSRDETVAILNAENILARAYYSPPLHRKKMAYPYVPATLPCTDELSQRFILLPCGDFVTREDISAIVDVIDFIYSHGDKIKNNLSSDIAG